MKRIHAIRLFAFAVFSFLVLGLCSARRSSDKAKCVKRREPHNKDYWGRFEITPSATTGPFGWKFTVKFSRKVQRLQIWNFEPQNPTSTDGGYTFELENKDGNYELEGGKTYEYDFTATVEEGYGRYLRCTELSFEPNDELGSGFNEI